MLKATKQLSSTKTMKTGIVTCSVCVTKIHRDKTTVCPDCDDIICQDCISSDKECSCSDWECSRCGGDLLDCQCI